MLKSKPDPNPPQSSHAILSRFIPFLISLAILLLLLSPIGTAAAQPEAVLNARLIAEKPVVAESSSVSLDTAVHATPPISATVTQLTAAIAANRAALAATPGSTAYLDRLAPELANLRDQNDDALVCILALGPAYNVADILGNLLPPPWDFGATMAAYGANLGLKFCAPVLVVPEPVAVDQESGTCSATFFQPRLDGMYSNLYGVPFPLDNNVTFGPRWGELGTPVAFHWNTDVAISLQHFGEEEGSYLRLPVGYNPLIWRGDTLIHPMDYIPLYVPGPGPDADNKVEREKLRELAQFGLAVLDQSAREALDGRPNPHADVYNQQVQYVIVRDLVAPTIAPQPGKETITLEAIEPGGLSAAGYLRALAATLDYNDDCAEALRPYPATAGFWPVGVTSTITWTVADDGPNQQGTANRATTYQYVEVVDTKPPILVAPPDIVTETASLPATLDLGRPAVFDLADLSPTLSNDAPATFSAGRTWVTWAAVDASGNMTTTRQLVNVKAPGTNTAPQAHDQNGSSAVAAISNEPITVTVTASDGDFDPLWFTVDEPPQHGFFVAPLFPYFIADYRMESSYTYDELRTMCINANGNLTLPIDFISEPEVMFVDDDGFTYVADYYYKCRQIAPYWPQKYTRYSKWDADGNYVTKVDGFSGDHDARYINVDLLRGYLYFANCNNGNFGAARVHKYNLDTMTRESTYWLGGARDIDGNAAPAGCPRNVVIDDRGVMYVANGEGSHEVLAYWVDTNSSDPNFSPIYIGLLINRNFIPNRHGAYGDLALDGDGNLYLSDSPEDRIIKFAPAVFNESTGWYEPGPMTGWLGRCDTGPDCDYINKHSVGFRCTDATCTFPTTEGDRPGQLHSPGKIAIDPNDNIYVTDRFNYRVQRFNADGLFAGEAKSTCDGSCFVLGDFGSPANIAVNSTHFYVLDRSAQLLHIFETAPFTQISDNDGDQEIDSATIVYRSDNNFVGSDSFTYRVTDGLLSDAGTIAFDVTRNYRPPVADVGITAVLTEDLTIPITLSGYDLDEDLDSLTFPIVESPQHGSLSGSSPAYTYTPDPEFSGVDTFTFAAADGRFTSIPETVTVTVIAANDAPAINMPATLTAGRGVTQTFSFDFTDPDPDDRHLLVIDWGDGTVEPEGTVTQQGQVTGPLLLENGFSGGSVRATHTYLSTGQKTLTICITDNVAVDANGNKVPTAASVETCRSAQVNVTSMIDMSLNLRDTADPITKDDLLTYEVTIRNHQLAAGVPQLVATGLELTQNLGPGLTFSGAVVGGGGGSCQHTAGTVTCRLDPLDPGNSVTVLVEVTVDDSLPPGTVLESGANLAVDQQTTTAELAGAQTTTLVDPADFLVNTSADGVDAQPGDNQCATAGGFCTLRAAVDEANAQPGPQTIALSDLTYQLDMTGQQALTVSDDLTLTGLGSARTVIAGSGSDRVIDVTTGASVTLSGLTLTGGSTAGDGGGLRHGGDALQLHDIIIGDNEAANGGGLANLGGSITLSASNISGNRAEGSGGAIFNNGSLTVSDTLISGNRAGSGGGIRHQDVHDLMLVRSTIAANEVSTGGGGIDINTLGNITLSNSTVSGNISRSGGGGIAIASGTLSIDNTTIADNVTADEDGDGRSGGGLLAGSGAAVTLQNTILGQNVDRANLAPDCDGSVSSTGHNLLGDSAGCGWQGRPSDLLHQPPRLYPLADSGGLTPTLAPRGESPAIEAGTCLLPADQRGVSRPVDGDLDGSAACDIGAHEFERSLIYLPVLVRQN